MLKLLEMFDELFFLSSIPLDGVSLCDEIRRGLYQAVKASAGLLLALCRNTIIQNVPEPFPTKRNSTGSNQENTFVSCPSRDAVILPSYKYNVSPNIYVLSQEWSEEVHRRQLNCISQHCGDITYWKDTFLERTLCVGAAGCPAQIKPTNKQIKFIIHC